MLRKYQKVGGGEGGGGEGMTLNGCRCPCIGLRPNLKGDKSQSHKGGDNREKQMNASAVRISLN